MLNFSAALAQEMTCATTINAQQYEILRSQATTQPSAATSRLLDVGDQTIPVLAITAHIVRTTSGEGGVSLDYLNEELDNINSRFLNAGLQFYIYEVNYVDNTGLYNFSFNEEDALADSRDVENTINIYFVNEVSFGLFGGTACGYAYLPGTGPDRILISNQCADNGSTVVHEIGHFFNLIHTHGLSNTAGNTDELVNGSNCNDAGDLVCDTPADPVLSENNVNESCNYVGGARDENNEIYAPDPNNIMSYSRVTCRDEFSSGQFSRMYEAYELSRNYLLLKPTRADFTPSLNLICETQQIEFQDLSQNAVAYNWTFEGGTPATSTSTNPIVTYNSEGLFSVSLEVTASDGEKDLRTYDELITVRKDEAGENATMQGFNLLVQIPESDLKADGQRTFQITSDYSSQGSQSVWINMFDDPDNGSIDRLYTEDHLAGVADEYVLQFETAYKGRSAIQDELAIGVEAWCSQEKSQIEMFSASDLSDGISATDEFFPVSTDWKRNGLFFMNPFPGEVFRLFFETESRGGNNLFIDNIKIRPVKPIDQDSLQLVRFYDALDGQLPWNMNESVQTWSGVRLSVDDKVEELDFSDFGMSGALPSDILELDELRSLTLDGNNLQLESVLTELSQLEELSIVNAGLTELPSDWSGMTSLTKIDLRNNDITELPYSLLSLDGLGHIDARNNKLSFEGELPGPLAASVIKLDISGNALTSSPNIISPNPEVIIDLSENNLSFDAIAQNLQPTQVYSPQKLIGDIQYFDVEFSLSLSCPIPVGRPTTSIEWYRNNELITDENASSLLVTDLSEAYYQCKATDTEVLDVSMTAKPFLVNTARSICDQNLAGIYTASSMYTDENAQDWPINSQISLTTTANQTYSFSDISFGVESQRYSGSDLTESLEFDCGEFFTPMNASYGYQILSTHLDINSGEIIIDWFNDRGGKGRSTLELSAAGPSNEIDILSFNFVSQSAPESIDLFNKTVMLRVGCNEFSNVPSFTLSDGATAYVNGTSQVTGVSGQDFTSPVVYTILAEDGATSADWTITLIEDPSVVDASYSIVHQTFCDPLNGAIQINDITVNGLSKILDVDEFDIKWSDDPNFENILSAGLDVSGLGAGQYYLRISEIFSGCGIQFDNLVIEDLTPVGDLRLTLVEADRSCGGSSTGLIQTSIDALSPDLTITWQKQVDEDWQPLGTFDGLLEISGLSEGLYRQVVLDNVTGCEYFQEATVVNQESVITANTVVTTNTDCATPNGSISIVSIIEDGSSLGQPMSGYTIEWFSDAGQQDLIGTTYDLSGLSAGTYYMKVINNELLCESPLYSFFVQANTLSEEVILESKTDNTLCSSVGSNGELAVSVNGIIEDYEFKWFGGSQISSSPLGSSASISGLSGGTYTVQITALTGAESGCVSTLTTSIINDLEDLDLELISTSVTVCGSPNGSVDIEDFIVNGSSQSINGAYEIEWSESRFFNEILSDRESMDDLAPGTYYARVTNTLTGCISSTASVSVGLVLPEIAPNFEIIDNTNCAQSFNGAVLMTGLEPLSDYQILWYGELPADGVSSISSGSEINNLPAGTYYTVVEHIGSGCSEQFSHTIIDQTSIPQVTVEITPQQNCTSADGFLEVVRIDEGGVAQGIDNYTVEWSLTDDFSEILSNDFKVADLEAGDYYLRVLNIRTGCSSAANNYQINDATVEPAISLISMSEEQPALDALGELEIAVEYDGEFSVEWFDGVSDATDDPIGTELMLSSLTAGNYQVNVTTNQDCSSLAEFEVTKDDRVLQTIDLDIPTEVFVDDGPILLSGSSTNELPIVFRVESGPGRMVLNDLVFTGAGDINIIAEASENDQYFAASESIKITVKPLMSLSGQVDGAPTGQAKLYNTAWQLVKQSSFSNNEYLISDLRPGQYYLEIVPSGFSNNSLVTFHPDVYFWKDAELIDLREDRILDLSVVLFSSNDTGNTIEGILGRTSGSTLFTVGEIKALQEPVRGVEVYLVDEVNSEVVTVGSTDFDGSLTFEKVPTGNYYMLINEIGNEIDLSSVTFSVAPTDGTEQFTLELGDNGQIELVVVSGIDEWTSGELNLFPNPVTNELNIVLERGFPYAIELRVFNLAGAMMISETIAVGSSNAQLPLTNLQSGTYLVQLSDPKGSTTKKIIKR